MKITKDEARILAAALSEEKYDLVHVFNKTVSEPLFLKLESLEKRLEEFGKDNRRVGRTSQDAFTDCLKRYSNIN